MIVTLDITKLFVDTLESFGFTEVKVFSADRPEDLYYPLGLYIKSKNRHGVEIGCNPWFTLETLHTAVGQAIVSMVVEKDLKEDR